MESLTREAGMGFWADAVMFFIGGYWMVNFIPWMNEIPKDGREYSRSRDLNLPEAFLVAMVICIVFATSAIVLASAFDGNIFPGHVSWLGGALMAGGAGFRPVGNLFLRGLTSYESRLRQARIKREQDPANIIAYCKRQMDEANRRREPANPSDASKKRLESLEHFNQACTNLIKFLEHLFRFVDHIEELDRKAVSNWSIADTLYSDLPAEHLQGMPLPGNIDPESRSLMRTRARATIKKLVVFFSQLPIWVGDLSLREEAAEIKGFQEAFAAFLPKTSDADGIIADVETGAYQARLIEELTAGPAVPVVPTAPHAATAMPPHAQLGRGGGFQKG